MFSMRISKNEIYSHCYAKFLNMFKMFVLACRPYVLTLFKWIGMDWNDQEWPPEQTCMVNSCSFGSRFGTVGLGHKLCDKHDNYKFSLHISKNEIYSHWKYETHKKNTIQMDRNGLEWPGMTPRTNLNGRFMLVRQ